MKTSLFACAVLIICGVACGDDSGEGGGGATSTSSASVGSSKASSGSGNGSTSASGSTSTATGSTATTASGTGPTTGSSVSASSSSTGGNAMIKASIASGDFFSNCMPGSGTDPVNGSFVLTLDNMGAGAGTYEIVQATLRFTRGADTLDWLFDANPASVSVPANFANGFSFDKVAGSGTSAGGNFGPCNFCGGMQPTTLTLIIDGLNDGAVDAQELEIGEHVCAF